MATFKNVSGEDREVSVDGRVIFVADGDSFAVDDEHAPTLRHQPHFLADDDTLARWEAEEVAAEPSDPAEVVVDVPSDPAEVAAEPSDPAEVVVDVPSDPAEVAPAASATTKGGKK